MKSYKMLHLGCANCAAKMEADIAKLPYVESVRVNFLTQKIKLEIDDEHLDETLQKANAICKKYEPDCSIVL